MLSNAYFIAKFRFDTAENEPAKHLQNLPILLTLTPLPGTGPTPWRCTGGEISGSPRWSVRDRSTKSSMNQLAVLPSRYLIGRDLAKLTKLAKFTKLSPKLSLHFFPYFFLFIFFERMRLRGNSEKTKTARQTNARLLYYPSSQTSSEMPRAPLRTKQLRAKPASKEHTSGRTRCRLTRSSSEVIVLY